jgi:hypothetical protein
MSAKSKKSLTIAVAALALTTASLAATGDALAKGNGGRRRGWGRQGERPRLESLRWRRRRHRQRLLALAPRLRQGLRLQLIERSRHPGSPGLARRVRGCALGRCSAD